MRINVHAGHTSQNGKAPGASGIVHESVENRKIKDIVIKILRSRGHTVYDCTAEGESASDNLYKIIKKCNFHKVSVDVSIHLNCYNRKAKGTETILPASRKARKYAERINANIAKLGYTNRGVKVRRDLYVLNKTIAPALLVETFFCDSKEDCARYKKQGVAKIALAIADGIAPASKAKKAATVIKSKLGKKKSVTQIAKEVINGRWGNGETRKKRLKKAGYDYTKVQREVNRLLK